MDVAKVAKDYFLSSQSSLLIPNKEYGARKMIQLGVPRSSSSGSLRLTSEPEGTKRGTPVLRPQMSLPVTLVVGTRTKTDGDGTGGKQWLHPADALLRGHILYTVKFLGECAVEQSKGSDTVKDAIRKMKFNKHIKRAEGQKTPKVELLISADAVKIVDPKTRTCRHQYPLHRISYCADDKSDKRMFSFIAKAGSGSQHFCYVFDSEKCAEEITLTIGQAFDLAYKRFLDSSTSDTDIRKQLASVHRKVQGLQYENDQLKKRIRDLEKLKDRADIEEYKKSKQIADLSVMTFNLTRETSADNISSVSNEEQSQRQASLNGRRLFREDSQTNGHHHSTESAPAPVLSPPPVNTRINRHTPRRNSSDSASITTSSGTNPFYASPDVGTPSSDVTDPFGMPVFSPSEGLPWPTSEQERNDIQAAFSRGLSFGTDDFSLEDLDPLSQR